VEPIFLTLDDLLELHEDQISRYGGAPGLRSLEALDSAVAQPKASFDGESLHRDIFDMAAAYLFHIVQNHPFVDGNKRAGTAAALTFLDLNEIEVDIGTEELVNLVLEVAQGRMQRDEIAQAFRQHAA